MKTFLASCLILMTFQNTFAQKSSTKIIYGKNIISFMPVAVVTNNNAGIGFSYERLANEYIGIRVPVMMAINTNYFNIGLEAKLYPGRNTGPAKYAISPMIMFGTGNEKKTDYLWNTTTNQYDQVSLLTPRTHFGFLLNQTFNFTIMQHFFIGMDGGLGINYYDNAVRNSNGNTNLSFLAQFQVLMGYRF